MRWQAPSWRLLALLMLTLALSCAVAAPPEAEARNAEEQGYTVGKLLEAEGEAGTARGGGNAAAAAEATAPRRKLTQSQDEAPSGGGGGGGGGSQSPTFYGLVPTSPLDGQRVGRGAGDPEP
jgi:hypothetical protein